MPSQQVVQAAALRDFAAWMAPGKAHFAACGCPWLHACLGMCMLMTFWSLAVGPVLCAAAGGREFWGALQGNSPPPPALQSCTSHLCGRCWLHPGCTPCSDCSPYLLTPSSAFKLPCKLSCMVSYIKGHIGKQLSCLLDEGSTQGSMPRGPKLMTLDLAWARWRPGLGRHGG